jgi:hypothetical protein
MLLMLLKATSSDFSKYITSIYFLIAATNPNNALIRILRTKRQEQPEQQQISPGKESANGNEDRWRGI